jgi:hypothetical protein
VRGFERILTIIPVSNVLAISSHVTCTSSFSRILDKVFLGVALDGSYRVEDCPREELGTVIVAAHLGSLDMGRVVGYRDVVSTLRLDIAKGLGIRAEFNVSNGLVDAIKSRIAMVDINVFTVSCEESSAVAVCIEGWSSRVQSWEFELFMKICLFHIRAE